MAILNLTLNLGKKIKNKKGPPLFEKTGRSTVVFFLLGLNLKCLLRTVGKRLGVGRRDIQGTPYMPREISLSSKLSYKIRL